MFTYCSLNHQKSWTYDFWQLMGLGLVIAGALALTDVSNINTDHIKPILDSIPVGSFEAGSLVKNLTTLIIVIGAFILLIAGLGLFGACCQNKFMLVTVSWEFIVTWKCLLMIFCEIQNNISCASIHTMFIFL